MDGRRKTSEEGSSASGSEDDSTGESATIVSNESSFGTVARAKITQADGSVTYINVPYETGAAGESAEGTPQVLGARRSATGDNSPPAYARFIVIILCIGIIISTFRTSGRGYFFS